MAVGETDTANDDVQDVFGVHEVGLKDPVTPDGNPDAEREIVWAVPVDLVTVMVLEPLTMMPDLVTFIFPEFERE